MIDTEALRKKVIDLAIQGKLTQQLPEDGNAEDLYIQIQKEKAKLVKEGKIKKEKTLPEISDDEIPFEIPCNWKWMRLIDVAVIINGDRGKNYPAKSSLSRSGTIPFISALNLNGKSVSEDENLLYLSEKQYDALGSGKLIKNDIVVCIRGSLGKHGRYSYDTGAIASSLVICRTICFPNEMGDYIMRWLDSSMFPKEIDKYDGGSAQPNLAAENLKKFLIPIPPFEEQKRIVDIIDTVFAQIDIIDNLQQQFESDCEILKGKIIDAGIRGMLTEQLPEDGNAEDLYAQIQEEKATLIKEGKIKKEKPLPEISDEDIPFEIPDNWKWVYMGDIFDHNTGKALNNADTTGVPLQYITTSNMYWDHFELDGLKTMYFKDSEVEKCTIHKGDLLICEGGDIGRSAIWDYDYEMRIQNHIHKLRGYGKIEHKYYYYLMWIYKESGMIDGRGIGLQGFSSKRVHSLIVPLPPIEEQKRIVKKLDELLETTECK